MSIKITTGSKPVVSSFHQLATEQPFISDDGCLCIKMSGREFIQLADTTGDTCTAYEDNVDNDMVVKKALPIISKWEF